MTKQMFTAMAAGLALAAATPAIAQQGGPTVTTASGQGPILSFSVSEEVRARPDQATVSAGVQTTAPTAVAAMQANAAAMDKLIAAARKQGIKAEAIQTSGISLSPQYDYSNRSEGQPPRFLGYQVTNSVRATTNDIAGIGPLLDALVAAGGTNIDGPWFEMKDADAMLVGARGAAREGVGGNGVRDRTELFAGKCPLRAGVGGAGGTKCDGPWFERKDPDARLVGARGAAIKAAEAKAQDYAKLAGFRTAELVAIGEGSFGGPQPPMPRVQMMAAEAKSTPVEPGQVGNTLTLSFQYRLVR